MPNPPHRGMVTVHTGNGRYYRVGAMYARNAIRCLVRGLIALHTVR